MIFTNNLSPEEKLSILSDAAKYDVACTSSGVQRNSGAYSIGNTTLAGICHSFTSDGRCVSLLKVLYTNECVYDCKYCINRASNDIPRATFSPKELCDITYEFYRRNYIEGLFLSSAVIKSPDYTMELLYKTLYMLRIEYNFGGYIHIKSIPNASPELVEKVGWLADRMSTNLELPTAEGLKALAPNKTRKSILRPIRQIQLGRNEYAYYKKKPQLTDNSLMLSSGLKELDTPNLTNSLATQEATMLKNEIINENTKALDIIETKRNFVPAGQSTQMIIGATPETDFQIVSVAEALYKNFDLKRVFYSAFIKVNKDKALPDTPDGPPLLREHRLYQADWLLRFYGFTSNEILSDKQPNFNTSLDPKCNWAISNLEKFPIEINRADYYTLLRVPGIGPRSAKRIIQTRKNSIITFEILKKLGVVLKRAIYFITCNGKVMQPYLFTKEYITNSLISVGERLPSTISSSKYLYQQMSLFE